MGGGGSGGGWQARNLGGGWDSGKSGLPGSWSLELSSLEIMAGFLLGVAKTLIFMLVQWCYNEGFRVKIHFYVAPPTVLLQPIPFRGSLWDT